MPDLVWLLIFGSVATLINYHYQEDKKNDLAETLGTLKESNPYFFPQEETFDFVIVGGGTAGCVLASRLSENQGWRILLLEIGGNPPPQMDVPAYMAQFLNLSQVAFQYDSVPQTTSSQSFRNGGRIKTRVGKTLGGTSAINGMFFNRGHPSDYDAWVDLTGDHTWKYENILPYFKKTERYEGSYATGSEHGTSGLVTVSSQEYAPGLDLWLKAGAEMGYKNYDPNGPQTISMTPIEFSKKHGKRVSSYDAYLREQRLNRDNLVIRLFSNVSRLIFSEERDRIVGVQYERHGLHFVVGASKEVILSAGTYGTPAILLRSGIGPEAHLAELGIKQNLDLPVGETLKEHPLVPLRILLNDSTHSFQFSRDLTLESVKDFEEKGTGPLTTDKTLSAQGFIPSEFAIESGEYHWPDIQLSLYSQDFDQLPVPRDARPNRREFAIFVLIYLARPKSIGRFTLNSKNHYDPLIDFQMLTREEDLLIYTQGINKTLEIFETTKTYGSVGARYSNTPLNKCSQFVFRSSEYWKCYLKELVFIGNHPCGTARMGSIDDPSAVVDSKLMLKGVSNLRIVDASVMPVIPNSNLQAAVYMIGEKTSAEIAQKWRQTFQNYGAWSSCGSRCSP